MDSAKRSRLTTVVSRWPVPEAGHSKARVCGRLLVGTVGSNPSGGHACLSVMSVVCCQVEVSVTS
jgi:hypothetical protein